MKLEIVKNSDLNQFKIDMQQAFQLGAIEGGFFVDDEIILPESDIDRSLNKENSVAYKVILDYQMVGGAIVDINETEKKGYLDFLYVKHGTQNKGIGKFIWQEIEKRYPNIQVWETCTPYFERRNIHFYINVCGFHIVEYFNKYHKDPNEPEEVYDEDDFGMFAFRKVIK